MKITSTAALVLSVILAGSAPATAQTPESAITATALPVPSPALEAILAATKSASPKQAGEIITAVHASPALTVQLNELVASGKLTAIIIVKGNGYVAGTQFRASVFGKHFMLTAGLLKELHSDPSATYQIVPNNTVFVLGHLAWHASHDAESDAANEGMAKDMWAGSPDGNVDATDTILKMMNGKMDNEALAFIQGWNDMIDAATIANGQPINQQQVASLLMKSRYGIYFMLTAQQPSGSVVFEPSSGRVEPNEKNIAIFSASLRTAPLADIQ